MICSRSQPGSDCPTENSSVPVLWHLPTTSWDNCSQHLPSLGLILPADHEKSRNPLVLPLKWRNR